jgi:hypothetical protein
MGPLLFWSLCLFGALEMQANSPQALRHRHFCVCIGWQRKMTVLCVSFNIKKIRMFAVSWDTAFLILGNLGWKEIMTIDDHHLHYLQLILWSLP